MRVGITGAAGFLGRAFARRSVERGDEVVGLDLDARDRDELAREGIRLVEGDLERETDIERFVTGLDRIIHCAAVVRESGDWSLFERVNVRATGRLVAAARAAGVKELLHISSVMVHGFDFADGTNESGALDPAGNPYCATKIASERIALAAHDHGRFEVFVLRPGDVYGPGSIPWTRRPVEMMRSRRWLHIDADRAIQNHVYVDNLVDAAFTILEARASGRPFIVTDGERTTTREFFSHYQRMLGLGWLPSVSARAAFGIAAVAERAERLLGREPQVNTEAVRYMLRRSAYDCSAVRALGYVPRVGLDEGMARSREWLESVGLVARRT
jgi:nucleoside-diphosphate-sugar epimerase